MKSISKIGTNIRKGLKNTKNICNTNPQKCQCLSKKFAEYIYVNYQEKYWPPWMIPHHFSNKKQISIPDIQIWHQHDNCTANKVTERYRNGEEIYNLGLKMNNLDIISTTPTPQQWIPPSWYSPVVLQLYLWFGVHPYIKFLQVLCFSWIWKKSNAF